MKKIALQIPRHVLNIEAVKRKEKRMDNLKANKIIAVDFDGTLCENKYPEIGEPRSNVIEYVKTRREYGDKIILWTCRVGEMLENAVKWCAERGLKFDAVNANLPEVIESFGGDTRKIFANEYIDDRNYPCRMCEIGFEEFEECRKMHEERLWNLKIEKLESIFGFKFRDWQKRYLKGDDTAIYGRGRGSGKTFIYCLRVLLEERAAFRLADFRSIRNKRGEFLTDVDCRERDHLILLLHSLQTINAKLVSAGFKTNLILDGEEK